MHIIRQLGLALVTLLLKPVAASACVLTYGSPNLADIVYADIVVVGTVRNYHIVQERPFGDGSNIYHIGYFDIHVDRVLKGQPTELISAALGERTNYLLPSELPTRPLLIALRDSQAAWARELNGSRLIPIDEIVSRFSVVNQTCRPPFMIDLNSDDAAEAIRVLLGGH